jgi:hypothetical protein
VRTSTRAYDSEDFYRAVFDKADMVHIIGHAHGTELDVGVAKKRVKATDRPKRAKQAGSSLPPVVISTGCKLQSGPWRKGLKEAGLTP